MRRKRSIIAIILVATILTTSLLACKKDEPEQKESTTGKEAKKDNPLDKYSSNKVLGLSFEDNLEDSSDKKNNGTFVGTETYVEGVNGGKAFDFNGASYISLGNDVSLQPENVTVSFWVKTKSVLSGEHIIAWTKNEWHSDGWYIGSNDTQALCFSVGNADGAEVAQQPLIFATSTSRNEFFPIDEWVNIVITYDKASKAAQMYRNGISQELTVVFNGEGIIKGSASEKVLGCNGATHAYSGKANLVLDEFVTYNTVVDKDAIAYLYTMNGGEYDYDKALQEDYDALNIKTKNVASDIVLPLEGSAGSAITWKTSDETVVSDVGVVTRPAAGGSDVSTKLTATLTLGELKKEKTFNVTVSAISDITDISQFNLEQVTVTDEYFSNSLQKENAYLLQLEADKLLAGFRETAGLNMKGAVRYSGQWEDGLIGGHMLGHYLTAVAQGIANPDTTEKDKKELQKRQEYIINELIECQENTKGKEGFIFGARILDKNNVELQFDNVQSNKTNITTQAWVPWYTMHKIIAGLVDTYNITGNEKTKTLASGLGDWTYNRAQAWSDSTHKTVLSIEYGGMNECLYDLYKTTKDDKHLEAAHMFDETDLFEKVLVDEENALNNRHANTTIPKFMGALNRYRAIGDEKYLEYAVAFWEMVVNKHTYITGGNSEWEHFGADYALDAERTNCNCETCNTYNMLKLTRELYKITGEKRYSDYYEGTLINAIMSSQNPETGMSMYFQPMDTGYFKVYGEPLNKFWCCTGSGIENFTKLNDSIYFFKDDTIIVNQYRSSTLMWNDNNLKLVQTSDVLNTTEQKFELSTIKSINGLTNFSIRFRIPDWAAGDVKVYIGDKEYEAKNSAGYIIVEGEMFDSTNITVTIPMEVTAENLSDGSNTYAFKYGPVVLSAELGTDALNNSVTGVNVTIPGTKKVDTEYIAVSNSYDSVSAFMESINDSLVRVGDTLRFELKNTDSTLTFSPHYMQYEQRYGIYWRFNVGEVQINEDEKDKQLFEENKLDTVQPGYGQYETDDLHKMEDNNSVGDTSDGTSRYAQEGGNFSYRMLVSEEGSTSLRVTFDKNDNGKSMKISIGGTEVYNQVLSYSGEERYYDVDLEIPSSLVDANKEKVTFNGAERMAVRIVFESDNVNKESARLCNYAYTYKTYK